MAKVGKQKIFTDPEFKSLVLAFFSILFGCPVGSGAASCTLKDGCVAHPQREFVIVGGLMSYAASVADGYRQAGIYVGRVLRGAVPTDLPVVLPSKFDFFINLKASKQIGLTIPPNVLARADRVIK